MQPPPLLPCVLILGIVLVPGCVCLVAYKRKKRNLNFTEERVLGVAMEASLICLNTFLTVNLAHFAFIGAPYPGQSLETVQSIAGFSSILILVYTLSRFYRRIRQHLVDLGG